MISAYISKHRPTPREEAQERVFLTPGSYQVTHISEDLSALSRDFPTKYGRFNVTATEMQKLMATDIAKAGASNATIRELATHTRHILHRAG